MRLWERDWMVVRDESGGMVSMREGVVDVDGVTT